MKNINFANNSSKYFNYENNVNDKIYLLTLQNKLKNIIIAIVNLRSIFIRNVIKTFESTLVKNVETSQIKI